MGPHIQMHFICVGLGSRSPSSILDLALQKNTLIRCSYSTTPDPLSSKLLSLFVVFFLLDQTALKKTFRQQDFYS